MIEVLSNLLFVLTPIIWIAFPILITFAVSKMDYLFWDPDKLKAGFKLEKRTWGPSYINYTQAKLIFSLT